MDRREFIQKSALGLTSHGARGRCRGAAILSADLSTCGPMVIQIKHGEGEIHEKN